MIYRVLTILLILLSLTAFLYSNELDESYQKMLTAYGDLKSWQAEIKQTNYFIATQTTLNSEGAIFFQKGQISIRYNKPNEQYMLVRDSKVTVYDKASKTAARMNLTAAVQSLNPPEIIKTFWAKSQKTLAHEKDNLVAITLTPHKDNQIKQIRFIMNRKTGYITQFFYLDKEKNSVLINFAKIKTNQSIPESVWKLPIPPDVKIMDL